MSPWSLPSSLWFCFSCSQALERVCLFSLGSGRCCLSLLFSGQMEPPYFSFSDVCFNSLIVVLYWSRSRLSVFVAAGPKDGYSILNLVCCCCRELLNDKYQWQNPHTYLDVRGHSLYGRLVMRSWMQPRRMSYTDLCLCTLYSISEEEKPPKTGREETQFERK